MPAHRRSLSEQPMVWAGQERNTDHPAPHPWVHYHGRRHYRAERRVRARVSGFVSTTLREQRLRRHTDASDSESEIHSWEFTGRMSAADVPLRGRSGRGIRRTGVFRAGSSA